MPLDLRNLQHILHIISILFISSLANLSLDDQVLKHNTGTLTHLNNKIEGLRGSGFVFTVSPSSDLFRDSSMELAILGFFEGMKKNSIRKNKKIEEKNNTF